MTRLAWKVFISSKPCRLIVILLQGFVQHMFDKLLFLLTPLKIAISYKVKKNSTKWNSRAERGCRTATSSMRASVHPARRAYCMIGKFSELSYHTIKNSVIHQTEFLLLPTILGKILVSLIKLSLSTPVLITGIEQGEFFLQKRIVTGYQI